MLTLTFPAFTFEIDLPRGWVRTVYPDGAESRPEVNDDDRFHAGKLGISPEEARLSHELAHHLVCLYCGDSRGSIVIHRDAHGFGCETEECKREEWGVAAFQYYAHNALGVDPQYRGPAEALAGLMDMNRAREDYLAVFDLARDSKGAFMAVALDKLRAGHSQIRSVQFGLF